MRILLPIHQAFDLSSLICITDEGSIILWHVEIGKEGNNKYYRIAHGGSVLSVKACEELPPAAEVPPDVEEPAFGYETRRNKNI
jgi:hypothetical protein